MYSYPVLLAIVIGKVTVRGLDLILPASVWSLDEQEETGTLRGPKDWESMI